MEPAEGSTEDLDSTIIEVDNKIKKRGRPKDISNRSRSSSVTSRDSSTGRSGNESGSEGNNRITTWLKKKISEEKKKKRKAESPEHGGKEPKKKNEEQMEENMSMGKQEDITFKMFKKIKDKLDSRDEEDRGRWKSLEQKLEKIEEDNKIMKKMMRDLEAETNKKLEKMSKEIDDIKRERGKKENINEIKVSKLEEAVKKMQSEIKEKSHSNRREYDSGKDIKENEKMKKELEWIVEEAEREKRKKNVIIKGLEIQDKEELIGWLAQKLEIKVEIRKIWKIRNAEKTIGIQLVSKEQKFEIMKRKNKLRGEKDKIYINDDATWKERQSKREVIKKRRELELNGTKCDIGHNKIITDKEVFYWNEKVEKWFRKGKREANIQRTQ
ncbi:golgin subfamily A member 6-like protein 2 [Camponotus floridanus]|uniref:golgin subfamily A member 6-like protein 2 n=1 Tax=Camponotus floridanus TaxID=104421 RepID=UPI000DC6A2F3|nr:golgin subfamily A member 6-like protein 2 [Camponotus floridanus]